MSKAVFPGTFDPITLGHEALIKRIGTIFDEVVVGVAAGVHKQSIFSLDERLAMTADVLSDTPNITATSFDGLLVDFMHAQNCRTIVRGLRAVSDFEFETQLASAHETLQPELETIFFLPDRNYTYLSSTIVREVALLGGEIEKFVSPAIARRLREKLNLPLPVPTDGT